jgi:hypothetical protein
MSKNTTSLILSVDEDELNLFKKQYLNLVDLQDEIEKMIETPPDKRKKKDYKKWKDDVNFLIDMYNAKSKYKTYNKIK